MRVSDLSAVIREKKTSGEEKEGKKGGEGERPRPFVEGLPLHLSPQPNEERERG